MIARDNLTDTGERLDGRTPKLTNPDHPWAFHPAKVRSFEEGFSQALKQRAENEAAQAQSLIAMHESHLHSLLQKRSG